MSQVFIRGKVTGLRRVAASTEVTISVPTSDQIEKDLTNLFGLPVEVEMTELPSDILVLRGGN